MQNPNLRPQRQKKVTELERPGTSDGAKSQLSRREREEIEKQKAKAHYQVSFYCKLYCVGLRTDFRD